VCTGVSLPTRYGSGIPGQQLPTRVRRHDSATSTFGDNITTDRTHHHPLFNARRPGVPCRLCTCMERSSTLSVICIVTSYLWTTSEDTPIPSEFLFVVFGRPFVKRYALRCRTVVLSCLSLTLVYCCQTAGWNIQHSMALLEVGLPVPICLSHSMTGRCTSRISTKSL